MSQKNGASRSPMTLKDFHGGSIPSDLPLPCDSGIQGSETWMSPSLGKGFGNDRSGTHREGSASSVRTFEDKASCFRNRNYDEDDRKPVESVPHSSHSADRVDDHGFEERPGGFPADRYTLEDQGSFRSGPSCSKQQSSNLSDRLPPSQVICTGFESEVYVHDEFGLIPVGQPPPPVPQESQSPQDQREVADTRSEQSTCGQFQQQMPNVPLYAPDQQIVVTSWRNPSPQLQSSVPPESASKVWTARRDGDINRTPTSEPPQSDCLGSSPRRPQSTPGQSLKTRAVDKVSSGRSQYDLTRADDRRQQSASPVSAQARESAKHKPSSEAFYHLADGAARGLQYASNFSQSRYSTDPSRGLSKFDSGRYPQLAVDRSSGAADQGFRTVGLSDSERPIHSPGEKGEASSGTLRGADLAGPRTAGFGINAGWQNYEEYPHDGFSGTDRFSYITTDLGRTGQVSDTASVECSKAVQITGKSVRISYVDPQVDSVKPELIHHKMATHGDASRAGLESNDERFSHFNSGQCVYPECPMGAEVGKYPSTHTDGVNVIFPETRKTAGMETGRESYCSAAAGAQAEVLEKPKLRFLPHSRSLENTESSNVEDDDIAGYEESRKNAHFRYDDKSLAEVLSVEAIITKQPVVTQLVSSKDENDEFGTCRVEHTNLYLRPVNRVHPTEAQSNKCSRPLRQLSFDDACPQELISGPLNEAKVLNQQGMEHVLYGALDAIKFPISCRLPSAYSLEGKGDQLPLMGTAYFTPQWVVLLLLLVYKEQEAQQKADDVERQMRTDKDLFKEDHRHRLKTMSTHDQQLQDEFVEFEEFERCRFKRARVAACSIGAAVATQQSVQRRLWVKNRSQAWWERCNHPGFPDSEFHRAFRMSRTTFEQICEELQSIVAKEDTMLRAAIPVKQRVAVCIWRLATGEPLRLVSKRFGLGISTCHKLILEVCAAINDVLLAKYVQWPAMERVQEVMDDFEGISGLQNVVGAMYTTHIPIIAPKINVGAYFNKRHTDRNQKTSYSITLQGVVDIRGSFTDVCIGWPGSMSDDRVLESSALYQKGIGGSLLGSWVVGGQGYPLLDWLMVPYAQPSMTRAQHTFNERLMGVQKVAKGAFSRLKGRWRFLQRRTEVKLQELPAVLGACCVLHNVCEQHGEGFNPDLMYEVVDDNMHPQAAPLALTALESRDAIAQQLHSVSLGVDLFD